MMLMVVLVVVVGGFRRGRGADAMIPAAVGVVVVAAAGGGCGESNTFVPLAVPPLAFPVGGVHVGMGTQGGGERLWEAVRTVFSYASVEDML